jgi:hypothetical protein
MPHADCPLHRPCNTLCLQGSAPCAAIGGSSSSAASTSQQQPPPDLKNSELMGAAERKALNRAIDALTNYGWTAFWGMLAATLGGAFTILFSVTLQSQVRCARRCPHQLKETSLGEESKASPAKRARLNFPWLLPSNPVARWTLFQDPPTGCLALTCTSIIAGCFSTTWNLKVKGVILEIETLGLLLSLNKRRAAERARG